MAIHRDQPWVAVSLLGILLCLSQGIGVHAQAGEANPFQENYGTPEDAPTVNLMPFVDPLPIPRSIFLPGIKGPLRLSAFRTSHVRMPYAAPTRDP